MKNSTTRLLTLAGAVAIAAMPALFAGTPNRPSAPTIITPPAIPDGSNYSRAPFPAGRPQNDVTPPNGMAFDQNMPPNTPSTNPEPFSPPLPTFAIFQPRVAPGLMPTGRPSVSAAASLDAPRVESAIHSAAFESRDDLVDTIRVRERQSERTMMEFRRTESQMSEQGRSEFQSVAGDVKSKQKELDRTVRSAAHASADNWEDARQRLGQAYNAYAAALARADAAVGIAPVQR